MYLRKSGQILPPAGLIPPMRPRGPVTPPQPRSSQTIIPTQKLLRNPRPHFALRLFKATSNLVKMA